MLRISALALIALLVTLAVTPASPVAAQTPCPDPVEVAGVFTVTCEFTDDFQTWTVPAGVTSATFEVQVLRVEA
jgi:hypothetical protein